MKQIIIIFATIILGVFIFDLIAGSEDGSIKATVGNFWSQEIERQNTYP